MIQFKLTQEDTDKNIAVFQKTIEKYNIITPELLDYLGADFFTAPASTMLDLHNCFPGGLLDHLVRVAKYAVNFNKTLPANMQQDTESILKVSFLSQIGKAKLYKEYESKWHRENLGKYYEFRNDSVSMRVGQRSAFIAMSNGVTLKDYEYQAIVSHDADDDDAMVKWYSDVLTNLLKTAIKFAIIEEKERWKSVQ